MTNKRVHIDKKILSVVNSELNSTLEHYKVHHDIYSFSKLFELQKTCKELHLTVEEIPRIEELKKLVAIH